MEITSWTLYWITRLDSICILLGISFMILLATVVVLAVNFLMERDTKILIPLKKFAIALALVGIFGSLVPDTKEAAVIIAVPAILNSKTVTQTMPEETKEIWNLTKQWLKQQAQDKTTKIITEATETK